MPAKTGQQYIDGLRDNPAEVWIRGERVKDVTTHPALRGGVQSVAALYDRQYDLTVRDDMIFPSPTSGRPRGAVFHGAEFTGGAAAPAQDDDPLGVGGLRNDGPDARLSQRVHRSVGRSRGLLRA